MRHAMGIFDKIAEWLMPGPVAGQVAVSAAQMPGPESLAPQSPAGETRAAEVSPDVSEVPAHLPKIAAKTAAEICMDCGPDPDAMKLLTLEQTPAQYLALLRERNLGSDMVKVIAEGLPDSEGVAWAVRCGQKVADKLPLADLQALRAAEEWLKHPTAERQAAAAAAAKKTDFQGPGAWAAQAAASAQNVTPLSDPSEAGEDDVPRLTPQAVCGAVMLSASVLAVPSYGGRLLAMLQAGVGAAAGVALAGASARFQAPSVGGMPAVPAVPNLAVPQLPGAAGKVQTALGTMPSVSGVGDIAGRLPGVAGAMASPAGAVAQGAISGGGAGAMAAALGSVPVLHVAAASAAGMAITVPGAAALANIAVSNPQMPTLTNPNLPNLPNVSLPDGSQLPSPTLPPPDPVVVFRGQQPFIEIGLGIASGKIPIA